MPVRGHIMVSEYRYFTFQIWSRVDFKAVYIQLTPILGDVGLFTSRWHDKPTMYVREKAACFCTNLIKYESSELYADANNTIYIGIYGYSNAEFNLNVIVVRKEELRHAALQEDVIQKAVFDEEEKYMYFDIPIPRGSYTNETVLEIHLTSIKGSFLMQANPYYKSNHSFYRPFVGFQYQSSENHLMVAVSDLAASSSVAPEGDELYGYRIQVQKLEKVYQSQFTISYSTGNTILEILEGQARSISLAANKTVWFKFKVYDKDESALVHFASEEEGIEMHVSSSHHLFKTLNSSLNTSIA